MGWDALGGAVGALVGAGVAAWWASRASFRRTMAAAVGEALPGLVREAMRAELAAAVRLVVREEMSEPLKRLAQLEGRVETWARFCERTHPPEGVRRAG